MVYTLGSLLLRLVDRTSRIEDDTTDPTLGSSCHEGGHEPGELLLVQSDMETPDCRGVYKLI